MTKSTIPKIAYTRLATTPCRRDVSTGPTAGDIITARKICPIPIKDPADNQATAQLPFLIALLNLPGTKKSITVLAVNIKRMPKQA